MDDIGGEDVFRVDDCEFGCEIGAELPYEIEDPTGKNFGFRGRGGGFWGKSSFSQ